ncbi:multiple coagulation factor deficiency protein 2 homolog [Watersipora subatra]|uniref:multiple coagulation factor deficiency protein 2 homolog n=1 Tax=Watersipora subatra TaxID=2589382 RepID=UPI00355B7634
MVYHMRLLKIGCTDKFISIIEALHTDMQANVAMGGHVSRDFKVMNWCVLFLPVWLLFAVADQFDPVEDVENHDLRQRITKDHVLEELEHQINTKDKKDMTEKELQFHYFKLHDFDDNNLLDGLEIVKALRHNHEQTDQQKQSTDDEVIAIVDNVLVNDDVNKDGYVSFYEFMAGQEPAT